MFDFLINVLLRPICIVGAFLGSFVVVGVVVSRDDWSGWERTGLGVGWIVFVIFVVLFFRDD